MALGVALLRNKHDNLVIEKCTELGCKVFYLMETERTIKKASDNMIEKYGKVAIAAIKQCDNAWLPEIKDTCNLLSTIQQMRADGFMPVVALESGAHEHLFTIRDNFKDQSLGMIIGPEGGFSAKERDLIHQEKVPAITLGNHILRAETAAVAAISLLAGINYYWNSKYY
jgi:16S rRNA (uracil1498-N3)-methyltransferase